MLNVQGINQYYGGSHILRNVNLCAMAGEVTVLLGRNGVGKTSLLKCLMGLVPVKSGVIEFNASTLNGPGRHLKPYERSRLGLGYVPQGREIFARLTVQENLTMGLAGKPAGTALPQQIFDLFPVLLQMRQRRGGDLSGGQQQQLAIGRALAARPKMLILDEPTEGIQPNVIKDIGRVIRRLAQQGLDGAPVAVLLVEQYYDFARELADAYYVMERGEMLAQGRGADMERDEVRRLVTI